ncbi:hypothetical protein RUE5091_04338 [Ruegeria denitrificans]|uniref:Uncharacterized protein n=1 Tax=Ruegeria denitrificans TaxID=1715692 RepID=A0A0P1J086_9RHOB|nr:hypothetical protein [Ruegeria denitrificans]CUK19051.1 hypothetical protein RUE5091_04338 [Ruegeria denitrificans]
MLSNTQYFELINNARKERDASLFRFLFRSNFFSFKAPQPASTTG